MKKEKDPTPYIIEQSVADETARATPIPPNWMMRDAREPSWLGITNLRFCNLVITNPNAKVRQILHSALIFGRFFQKKAKKIVPFGRATYLIFCVLSRTGTPSPVFRPKKNWNLFAGYLEVRIFAAF